MIEISANLSRGSVYLLGELVECVIEVRNSIQNSDSKAFQSSRDSIESLAWATVQIICYSQSQIFNRKDIQRSDVSATVSRNIEILKSSSSSSGSSSTALSIERRADTRIEYVTNPCILFCDLQLLPGQSRIFQYKETLPLEAPPTYHGHYVKYLYKLVIATQRISSPVKKVNIPFRVLSFDSALIQTAFAQSHTEDEVTPSNPFLVEVEKITPSDIALEEIQNITSRRQPNSYLITNDQDRVCRFCLFKKNYKLGEDIIGTFDFGAVATVRCVQILVSLQSVETVKAPVVKQAHERSVSKTHLACAGYAQCDFSLPIPFYVTPTFQTDLMSLSWKLKFEFVITNLENYERNTNSENKWEAPHELPIKTITWSLPIEILSNSPIQVSQCE